MRGAVGLCCGTHALDVPLRPSAVFQKPGEGRASPFPRADLSNSVRDGYAERRVVIEHGDMDLKIRDVVAEIPRHEVLSQQLHAMHPLSERLRFDAALALVSAPSLPQGSSVDRRPENFLSATRHRR